MNIVYRENIKPYFQCRPSIHLSDTYWLVTVCTDGCIAKGIQECYLGIKFTFGVIFIL